MKNKLKKYFSFLFLILFLFPIAEKQLHAFTHRQDIHCSSSDKHFHEAEHICSICDYTSTDSTPSTETIISFFIPEYSLQHDLYSDNTCSCILYHHLPSRAPPVI